MALLRLHARKRRRRIHPALRWCALGLVSVGLHALALGAIDITPQGRDRVVRMDLVPSAEPAVVTGADSVPPVPSSEAAEARTAPDADLPHRDPAHSPPAAAASSRPRQPDPPPSRPGRSGDRREPVASAGPAVASGPGSDAVVGPVGALGTRPAALAPGPAVAGRSSAPEAADGVEAYVRALARAIGAHRRYPARARRRAEEGTVVVGLEIRADGTLAAPPVVTESSDVASLDASAVEAVTRSLPLPPPPRVGPAGTVSLRVPFVYHLRN